MDNENKEIEWFEFDADVRPGAYAYAKVKSYKSKIRYNQEAIEQLLKSIEDKKQLISKCESEMKQWEKAVEVLNG